MQNQKLDAVKYLLDNFEVDVLAKNSYGRSALTDAFQSGNTDVIEACLSHSSSTEERLLSSDVDKIKDNEESEQALAGAVTHLFNFRKVTPASGDICQEENQEVLTVRELPITRADNPFGNESAPQDDTTGVLSDASHCFVDFKHQGLRVIIYMLSLQVLAYGQRRF